MTTKVIPLNGRIIVKPQTQEEVTSFGLVLSDAGKEKPMQGTVVAISDIVLKDGTKKPCPVKEGEVVLYKKYSPTEFKTKEGEELLVLDIEDILAKLEA